VPQVKKQEDGWGSLDKPFHHLLVVPFRDSIRRFDEGFLSILAILRRQRGQILPHTIPIEMKQKKSNSKKREIRLPLTSSDLTGGVEGGGRAGSNGDGRRRLKK